SRGLEGASLPLVLVTTAQESWTAAHLEPLLKAINHCDHVVGCRPARGWEWSRRRLAMLPRRLIFGVPLLDIHSPCRIHRREKLAAIPLQSTSSFLDVEIFAKATFLGHLIDEVDVPPLRGLVRFQGWRSDWNRLLRYPCFHPSTSPTEESSGWAGAAASS